MATLLPEGKQSFTSSAGAPLVGGKVYTYDAGTNSPRPTYQDAAGTVPNTNPVILDARGEATIFWSGAYKVVLKDAADVTIWTIDNVVSADQYASIVDIALRSDLSSTTDVSKGDALIGVKRTASGAVATTLHSWIEGTVLDVGRDFGVVADNATDQTAKMITAIACATVLAPCTLELPKGTIYCATSLGNLAVHGLRIKGRGIRESAIRFGQVGVAMNLDAFASGSPSDPFVSVDLLDFTVVGNANTTAIVQAQGIARSTWKLNVREAEPVAGIGFWLKGVQLSTLELTCSTDIQAMTSVPAEGLRMEAGTRAGASVGNSSNNLMLSTRMVGLKFGTRLTGADQNTFVGGACESNTVYGCLIGTGCRYNTFIGHGFENPNSSSAAFADAGESTRLFNCYSDKTVLLQGVNCWINGGFWERIEVQAGAIKNRVSDVRLNNWRVGSGGFYDSGTATEWKNLRGTTFNASFNGSVMTVNSVAQGTLAVGQEIYASGVATGVTIASLGTGTGGTGTYNLSANVGVLGARTCSSSGYVYPLKDRTAIVVGASPFSWVNTTGQYVEVVLQTGTVSQIRILRSGDTWLNPTAVPGKHLLAPTDTIEVSYSVAPTMSYVPHNGFQG